MRIMEAIKALFVYPFAKIRREIAEIQAADKIVQEHNKKLIEEIKATLNGEEYWMIRRDKDV